MIHLRCNQRKLFNDYSDSPHLVGLVVGSVVSSGVSLGMSKLFGGSNKNQKAINMANDANHNTQQLTGYFDNIFTGSKNNDNLVNGSVDFRPYYTQGFLDDNDIAPLTDYFNNKIIPSCQNTEGGYYGGLGSSYTSKYTGVNFTTVPGVGVAQDIDNYITQKLQSQTDELIKTNTIADSKSQGLEAIITNSNLSQEEKDSLLAKTNASQITGQVETSKPVTSSALNLTPYLLAGAVILGIIIFMRK